LAAPNSFHPEYASDYSSQSTDRDKDTAENNKVFKQWPKNGRDKLFHAADAVHIQKIGG